MAAVLEREQIRLEPLSHLHADALFTIYADPAVSERLFSRATSREDFDVLFRRALIFRESHGMWAVVLREDDAFLGRVGFFSFGEQERPELAFLLTRSAWGRGVATEACRLAIGFALQRQNWAAIVALVRPSNVAALRVLRKLRFAPESSLLLNGDPASLWQAPRERLDACRITSGCS
jgi:[ribosomal protein S5]-alanine N-acetyltransferase